MPVTRNCSRRPSTKLCIALLGIGEQMFGGQTVTLRPTIDIRKALHVFLNGAEYPRGYSQGSPMRAFVRRP